MKNKFILFSCWLLESPVNEGIWEFPKLGVPYLGVVLTRILLCRLLY